MDLKRVGSRLYLVGRTRRELGGSLWMRLHGRRGNGAPALDDASALSVHRAMHRAIRAGLAASCHDVSEGGLAVAAAEMAIAGGLGLDIDLAAAGREDPELGDDDLLFSESPTRFLVEVRADDFAAFDSLFSGLPCRAIGGVTTRPALIVRGRGGRKIVEEEIETLRGLFESGLGRQLEGEDRG